MDYSLLVGIKRRNFAVMNLESATPPPHSHSHSSFRGGSLQRQQQQHFDSGNGSLKMSSASQPLMDAVSDGGGGNCDGGQDADAAATLTRSNLRRRSEAGENADHGSSHRGGESSKTAEDVQSRDKTFGALRMGEPVHAAVVEGQGSFYVGIIDILQEWNWEKWREMTFKTLVLRKDRQGISSMEPVAYRRRFFQRAVVDAFDGLGQSDMELLHTAVVGMYTAAPLDSNLFRESIIQMSRGSPHSGAVRSGGMRQSDVDVEAGDDGIDDIETDSAQQHPGDVMDDGSERDVISPLPMSLSRHGSTDTKTSTSQCPTAGGTVGRERRELRPLSVDTLRGSDFSDSNNLSSAQTSDISTRGSDSRFAVRPLSSSESVQ